MRLYQSGALLTGARNEFIPHGAVLVDGPRIIAAGPAGTLMAEHPVPADVVDLGDVTLLPGLVNAHVHLGLDAGPGPVAAAHPDRPGRDADLIAVRGDPRTGISVLNQLAGPSPR